MENAHDPIWEGMQEDFSRTVSTRILPKFIAHVQFTVKTLETVLAKRGDMTRGKTKWELQLLYSAYETLGTPNECRKFGLQDVKDIKDVHKS